ncbi:helix-turn-helix domain-containing protein [Streptomyces hawaiiensis]|uniref:helix-turn-helix domain-containing protein n=1 Tax=Streptomyces hawaiiensis TaxID=67305 RepID=UPI003662A08D
MPETNEVTFAAQLQRLRGELSLRALALRANCSKSIISDLEHQRRTPTHRMACALDKALRAGGTLVALAEAERQRANERAAPTAPDGAVDGLLREWENVFRRDFLKGTGATAAVLAAGLGVEDAIADDTGDLIAAHKDLDRVLRGEASLTPYGAGYVELDCSGRAVGDREAADPTIEGAAAGRRNAGHT